MIFNLLCYIDYVCACICVCKLTMYICIVGLKQMVILAFKYSLSFQTNNPNMLLNIRSNKITVFW